MNTRTTIGPDWVRTVLPSGAEVFACPDGTEEQAATARRLGYGEDVAAMTRDHDPLHSALAEWLGLHASYALRRAAGELTDEEQPMADIEEEAVLAVQRLMRAAGVGVPNTQRRAELLGALLDDTQARVLKLAAIVTEPDKRRQIYDGK